MKRRWPAAGGTGALRLAGDPWRAVFRELQESLGTLLDAGGSRSRVLLGMVLAPLVAWWLYVPVHELLHALGCLLAGGTVRELLIAPEYGGALLERWIPFVRGGGEFAGRLSGFDTGGSDLVYLATDAAPFLPTALFGVALLRLGGRSRRWTWFGTGFVLSAAPLISLTGDYYEMGSILVSDLLGAWPGGGEAAGPAGIRTDDLAALLGEFPARFPDHRLYWGMAVALSAATGTLLATATLEVSRRMADLLFPVDPGNRTGEGQAGGGGDSR